MQILSIMNPHDRLQIISYIRMCINFAFPYPFNINNHATIKIFYYIWDIQLETLSTKFLNVKITQRKKMTLKAKWNDKEMSTLLLCAGSKKQSEEFLSSGQKLPAARQEMTREWRDRSLGRARNDDTQRPTYSSQSKPFQRETDW